MRGRERENQKKPNLGEANKKEEVNGKLFKRKTNSWKKREEEKETELDSSCVNNAWIPTRQY